MRVVLGHGPIHLLSASAAEIGFRWNPNALAWVSPGLPMLSNLAGPLQHFKAAILDAWRNKVAADFCGPEGFRGGPLLDVRGSLQLLNSSHVRERDIRLCFVASWLVVIGMVFSLTGLGVCLFLVASVVLLTVVVISFRSVLFLPLVEIRENPEFHDLMRMDKAHWPRCLLWHGWLPFAFWRKIGTPLGLLMLLRVLATSLRSRSGVILLTCLRGGVPLMGML